jgi:flagellar FliJ protein
MKPFSLEHVLDYRVQLEKLALNRFYAAKKVWEKARQEFQHKEHAFKAMIEDLAQRQSLGMDIGEMIRYEERIELLKNELNDLRIRLAEKEKIVQREREIALQKSKERKVMEKLKERQNAAWRRYLDKKEAAVLDEIAVIFHNR